MEALDDFADPRPALPFDVQAEKATISAVFNNNNLFRRAKEILSAADFWVQGHRYVFSAMDQLHSRGEPIDLVTVTAQLAREGNLDSIGAVNGAGPSGAVYVSSLLDVVSRSANVEHYARIVRTHSANRAIIGYSTQLIEAASNTHTPEETKVIVDDLNKAWLERCDCTSGPRAMDLAKIESVMPQFTVENLIREAGLHLIWGQPSAGKTYTLLRWCAELLMRDGLEVLSGHPDLIIRDRWTRVLWIATEETGAGLAYKFRRVLHGLGDPLLRGEIEYLFAADSRRRLSLLDLPELVARHAPLNAVVLDSLTGLRPRELHGQKVRWDLDNDAANEMCGLLRGLCEEKEIALLLSHHTGRETGRGYRGPTDWWASADVQVGLVPEVEAGRVKVQVEKNRDGRKVAPFYCRQAWPPDSFDFAYEGAAPQGGLTKAEEEIDAFLRPLERGTQAEIVKGTGRSRGTVIHAADKLVKLGRWRDTGEKVNGSPIFEAVEP